ncbi:MAG: hypothetical protein QM504_06390 [Pseudomonadota bacterium]
MTPLTTLINQSLKKNKINRNDLALKIGYKNIPKGLRVIDGFTQQLIVKNEIDKKLLIALNIPVTEYKAAILKLNQILLEKEKYEFKPSIQIILSGKPSPIFLGGFYSYVNLPKNLNKLSFENEIASVVDAYRLEQIKNFIQKGDYDIHDHSKMTLIELCKQCKNIDNSFSWAIGNGFHYFRKFDDIITFDALGNIVNRDYNPPQVNSYMKIHGHTFPFSIFTK